METYWLCFTLLSDATFGRGEGLAGLVDQEVDHDRYGLPYLRGRSLKGLLNEECANILYALEQTGADHTRWKHAAQRLLGGPGSTLTSNASLRVGSARLPDDLRLAVRQALEAENSTLRPADILDSLTAIRRQTAVDEKTGAPDAHTLRAARVVLRQTSFRARLTFPNGKQDDDLPLLAACALALRRIGTSRNRGRGRMHTTLHEDQQDNPGADVTRQYFDVFAQEVRS
jgi:CRISPR/Cas system CSM-associated protein Csm3 (group 7 of RAMP superfamily)